MWQKPLIVFGFLVVLAESNYPVFDVNTQMRLLLVPSDAKIGSVIYRLRATDADKDYPLVFDATDYGSYVIRIDNLPCTRNSSYCEANVFLERSVVRDQVFKFRVTVKDTKGDTSTIPVTIQITDGTTDFNGVFPHIPGVIMIPESTELGTELEYVIVRKNPRSLRQATLELWGSKDFKFQTSSKKDSTTGVITLAAPLDYEKKTMYKLSIFAVGMYVDIATDTRNIAGFQVVIIVTDVQDTPPVWDHIDPITELKSDLSEGDVILKVTARDGDKGSPREVKYGLVSEKNPFVTFFEINPNTGEIRLSRPLRELTTISRSHQPIVLTVVAEEVVIGKSSQPAMSSTATVALLLGELGNTPPYFESHNYVTRLNENSLQGTPLIFPDPYTPEVKDNDMGKQGIFSLELENNNGTFEISPTVAERQAQFIIRVRDNSKIDYESNKYLSFKVVARELNPGEKQLSTSANVTVYINDVNDNPPIFTHSNYSVQIPENTTVGTLLITVEATDTDTGEAGIVKYTSILGYKNTSLDLNPDTGVITLRKNNHGLDREETKAYQFQVEARDMQGSGNVATVPFTIEVTDVNDNPPYFEKSPMEFILGPDGTNFSQRAFIKAVDDDAESPNNEVRYEIVNGNYGNRFLLNSETGELIVNNRYRRIARQTAETVSILLVRAYDRGVPVQWTNAEVRIYPAESRARVMKFIVPGGNPDRYTVEQMLSAMMGGRVVIQSILPYTGQPIYQARTTDLTYGNSNADKSIVTATVLYNNNAVVDVDTLQKRFMTNRTATSTSVQETRTVYQSESTTIFWVFIFLLLLLILAILFALLCCCWTPCPFYGMYDKNKKVKSVENINYSVHGRENKEVQAEWIGSGHKEAWSADNRQWNFNRRQNDRRVLLMAQAPTPESYQHHNHRPSQPNIIFTREVSGIPRHTQDELILEDMDGTEYRILDPSRLGLRAPRQDPDSESMRRHEYERGSQRAVGEAFGHSRQALEEKDDVDGYDEDNRPPSRDQMFIRDGNAEILRLVTRGRVEEEEDDPKLNQPDRPYTIQNESLKEESNGKEVLMRRFIEDQRNSAKEREERMEETKETAEFNDENEDFLKRLMDAQERGISTADVTRLTTLQRDLLLTRFLVEEQRRSFNQGNIIEDTQSLPGMMTMATQTDVDMGTQTDKVYFLKRRAKSDNDDSLSDSEELSKDFKRFKRYRRTLRMKEERSIEAHGSASRCEIKTPILEESESTVEGNGNSNRTTSPQSGFTATKSSLLRQAINRGKLGYDDEANHQQFTHEIQTLDIPSQGLYRMKSMSDQDIHSLAERKERILMSLQVTPVKQVNIPGAPNVLIENVQHVEKSGNSKSGMSVGNISRLSVVPQNHKSRAEANSSKQEKRKRVSTSEPPSRRVSSKEDMQRSVSKENIKNNHIPTNNNPRYMEWYKKKREEREKKRKEDEEEKKKPVRKKKEHKTTKKKVENRTQNARIEMPNKVPAIESVSSKGISSDKNITNETITENIASRTSVNEASNIKQESEIEQQSSSKEVASSQGLSVPENHIQKLEDDLDSGIAMSLLIAPTGSQTLRRKNQQMLEKKSVFTIAYDEMETKQIRLDTASPP